MGTALNKILKDIVIKSRTMAGFQAPFLPGWDCHGLPIEFKVVKETRGLNPLEIRQRSEALARKFIDIQRRQFKRLGIFGAWERPYLTMDPAYEAEILRAFARLVELGLVYQSKKPVYWSTGAGTALAEAEVEYQDEDAPAIFVKFPLVSGPLAGRASIVIWTTTPWTLPANQAIAVNAGFGYRAQTLRSPHTGENEVLLLANALVDSFCRATGYTPAEPGPNDTAFLGGELEGWLAQHPFLDRQIPLILGDFVTLEAGSGCVHIAPGHGNDDFIVGRKYGLPVFSPVDDDGRYTEDCGLAQLIGKYVFAASPEIIALLQERGMLAGEGSFTTAIRIAGARKCRSSSARWSNFYPHGSTAAAGPGGDRPGAMAAALGPQPHLRHGGIPAGLVHLAPTQLGRSAARLLRRRRRAHPAGGLDRKACRSGRAARHQHLVRSHRYFDRRSTGSASGHHASQ